MTQEDIDHRLSLIRLLVTFGGLLGVMDALTVPAVPIEKLYYVGNIAAFAFFSFVSYARLQGREYPEYYNQSIGLAVVFFSLLLGLPIGDALNGYSESFTQPLGLLGVTIGFVFAVLFYFGMVPFLTVKKQPVRIVQDDSVEGPSAA